MKIERTFGHAGEIAAGSRFAFGKNWRSFLERLNEDRIREACRSMEALLGEGTLRGRTFIDVGSGSGLFSLAAMRLGAAEVRSFDYDPSSVECANILKGKYYPDDARWSACDGSVLDKAFLGTLGRYDIVYSWGVLHHTGNMWQAIDNIRSLVSPNGRIAIAIYNDQGWKSRAWRGIKKLYCRTPGGLRPVLFLPIPLYFEGKWMAADLVHGKAPFASWRKQSGRGMSPYHDWIDWLGGYPFEVARPEEVADFFHLRRFTLEKLNTCGEGWANNEFVFRAPPEGNAAAD